MKAIETHLDRLEYFLSHVDQLGQADSGVAFLVGDPLLGSDERVSGNPSAHLQQLFSAFCEEFFFLLQVKTRLVQNA